MTNMLCGELPSRGTREEMHRTTARIRNELELSQQSLRLATDAAEVGAWDLDLATPMG